MKKILFALLFCFAALQSSAQINLFRAVAFGSPGRNSIAQKGLQVPDTILAQGPVILDALRNNGGKVLAINNVGKIVATTQDTGVTNWSLTGNTILSTNFLGSKNNQPLLFKQNNKTRIKIDDPFVADDSIISSQIWIGDDNEFDGSGVLISPTSSEISFFTQELRFFDNTGGILTGIITADRIDWMDNKITSTTPSTLISQIDSTIRLRSDTLKINNQPFVYSGTSADSGYFHRSTAGVVSFQTPPSGTGTVTTVSTKAPLTGGPINSIGTLGLNKTQLDTVGTIIAGVWNGIAVDTTHNAAVSNVTPGANVVVNTAGKTKIVSVPDSSINNKINRNKVKKNPSSVAFYGVDSLLSASTTFYFDSTNNSLFINSTLTNGNYTITNSILDNCIIDFGGQTGVSINNLHCHGSSINYNDKGSIDGLTIEQGAQLTLNNGTIKQTYIGAGSTLLAPSSKDVSGVHVFASDIDNPIIVDLNTNGNSSTNCIYEITHTSSSTESGLAFRKDRTILNLQNNSAAVPPQTIADGTNYPSMYEIDVYSNVDQADVTGGPVTFTLNFNDFSGTNRIINIGTINTIDQTTNPILSISIPIYSIGPVEISTTGSLGSSSYDIQASITKLN